LKQEVLYQFSAFFTFFPAAWCRLAVNLFKVFLTNVSPEQKID
jgi:hypothetical protein